MGAESHERVVRRIETVDLDVIVALSERGRDGIADVDAKARESPLTPPG
jgi:hypothetical protein